MCGGAGTRLWPASREGRPKQFLPLFGPHSTFQDTIRRVSDPALFGRPIVVTNNQYRFLVAEQLAAIGVEADIMLEPMRRDSGPAIAAGAAFAVRRDGDPLIVALAADHVVTDAAAFAKVCGVAADAAADNRIVTFGVRPTRPATEYGYIRAGAAIGPEIFAIEKFVEKPDAKTAERYVKEGYLWNSGNFMFRAGLLLEEYRGFEPDSVAAVTAAVEGAGTRSRLCHARCRSVCARDGEIDRLCGDGTHQARRRDAGLLRLVGCRLLAGGVGAVRVATRSAIPRMVRSCSSIPAAPMCRPTSSSSRCSASTIWSWSRPTTPCWWRKREDGDGLRRLVQKLKEVAPEVTEEHLKVHRPWGSYQSVDQGERFQVKRIVVKPGGRLSLQLHHHRAEHWIVVRGTARVTVGDETKIVHENESTYIPIGAKHRLENPGKIDLELIEVQTGSYLGEDDIIRIEDDYRRS